MNTFGIFFSENKNFKFLVSFILIFFFFFSFHSVNPHLQIYDHGVTFILLLFGKDNAEPVKQTVFASELRLPLGQCDSISKYFLATLRSIESF